MKEVWKDIPNYEGFYQASNFGRIRSLTRIINVNNGKRKFFGKLINIDSSRSYKTCCLCKNGNQRTILVHKLVCQAFFGLKKNYNININHKNGIKHDNRLKNLEYCTRKENTYHARKVLNIKFGNFKIKKEQLKLIKKMLDKEISQEKIGNKFGVTQACISLIKCNKTWK